MDKDSLQASYDCLGLSPGASTRDVEQAFRELRDLYSDESLATYSLLEYADRQEKLEALQSAYDLILNARLHLGSDEVGSVIVVDEKHLLSDQIVCVDADPKTAPGKYLRQMREARGLSVSDIAERTKVGSFQLQGIEGQRFDVLPAPVYLRGFLKEYARVIEAPDIDLVVDGFIALYLESREPQN